MNGSRAASHREEEIAGPPLADPEARVPSFRGAGRWASGIGAAAFLAVALTIADPGVTWDEPDYLISAKLETAWVGAVPGKLLDGTLGSWVSADTLEAYWNHDPYHNPHPPFYKLLGGITRAAFHRLLGEAFAFRLATAALFGGLMAVLFLWGARGGGTPVAGAAAALALALMPRVFGDAHMAATDMPLTVFWGVAAYFFWRAATTGSRASILLFGAFWGMALATKFHGFLVPLPLAVWAGLHARRHLVRTLLLGGTVAAATMVLLNPHLWPDPLGRVLAFIGQSTSRDEWAPVPTYYLGRFHPFVLPWHHALVLTLVTVPLPILALAGAGTWRLGERRLRPLVSLCLIQIAFYQVLLALPSSPGHNGVRLFLPQFTFVALLAGLGFAGAWSVLSRRARQFPSGGARPIGVATARAALTAAALVPAALGLVRSHPHELAYYNEVVGGVRGAYARGFETTYWFDAATPGFLRRLEQEVPAGARVWAHPAPWHYTRLQDAGLLRRDIVFTDSLPAPFLLLMSYQGTFGPFEWRLHKDVPPLVTESYDGVPLLALYRGWE